MSWNNPPTVYKLVEGVKSTGNISYFFSSIEMFDGVVKKLIGLWRSVLQREVSLQDASRFLKMMVINIFSIHNAAERHSGNIAVPPITCFICDGDHDSVVVCLS